MSTNPRQNEISMASLYYRCEKYSDIIKIAKELIKENPILSKEELSLFAQGYKCKLNEIRKPLIKLLEIEKKEKNRGSTHAHLIRELINPKISEIINLCDDFNSQIDILILKAKNFDDMANLSRLKLDFLRYKCQFMEKSEENEEEYQKAHDEFFETVNKMENIGKEFLGKNNINLLYIQLCKCVFYYEVLNKSKEAVDFGKNLLRDVLTPPEKPRVPKPVEKVEEKKEEEVKSVLEEEKKSEKKEDTNKKNNKPSAKKTNSSKPKEETKEEKEKSKDVEPKNTESREDTLNEKTLSEKKTENNFSSKEATKDSNAPSDKMIMTPELKQFIYILRTDIILWSGKHESDVKL